MNRDDVKKISAILFFVFPILGTMITLKKFMGIEDKSQMLKAITSYFSHTPLIINLIVCFVVWLIITIVFMKMTQRTFQGAEYSKFFRGSNLVKPSKLASMTEDRNATQIKIEGIPIPTEVETLHHFIAGATGVGKSVLIRKFVFEALKRGDRQIIVDPNGDMLSKFYKEGDVILNPFDARTEKWSFFNEIKNNFDYDTLIKSLITEGATADEESFIGYGRLIVKEASKRLKLIGKETMDDLFKVATIMPPDQLKEFLKGTDAESLFDEGASKALASARFTISKALSAHRSMPTGDFSIRDWLENGKGNLYITWREDMAEALRPLISTWIDIICISILSLEEDRNRKIWLNIDELASLTKLPSLEDALTKGRKHGLRVIAGLQSTAQLEKIYGKDESIILRSCFRNIYVLGGAKTDPETREKLSDAIGKHEVEREKKSTSVGTTSSRSTSIEVREERIVSPDEIANMKNLECYIGFANGYPVTKIKMEFVEFKKQVDRIITAEHLS